MKVAAPAQAEVPLAYKTIKQRLLRHIRKNYEPGSRLPPVPDLARQLGTGQVNTYRAVRELVSEGVVVSRRRHGSFVAKRPEEAGLAQDESPAELSQRRVAMIYNGGVTDNFLRKMVEGCEAVLREAGLSPIATPVDAMRPQLPSAETADAVVLFNPNTRPLLTLDKRQVGLVVQSTPTAPLTNAERFDRVGVEQEQGGQIAGRLLRESGQEDVCFVGVRRRDEPTAQVMAERPYHPISEMRLIGFERGFGKAVPADRRLLTTAHCFTGGAEVVPAFLALRPRPQAIFAASDDIAMGFITGMLAHGLYPGKDYLIVGFDGQEAGRSLATGPLTTVRVPSEQMGRRGAQLLLNRLANPDQPVRHLQLGCSLWPGVTA